MNKKPKPQIGNKTVPKPYDKGYMELFRVITGKLPDRSYQDLFRIITEK